MSDVDEFKLRLTTECQTADINVVYEEIENGVQLISLSKGNASIKINVSEDDNIDGLSDLVNNDVLDDFDIDEDDDYLNDYDDVEDESD